MRTNYGDCIGCGQPIRPPYLSFDVHWNKQGGIENWEEIDVCAPCSTKLTAAELHRLVTASEEEAAA